MDQLRTVLNWLKQQHFWVLSGVVALIGLFCWWSASRAMSAKYDANQRTITTQYNNIVSARNPPFLPNQAINDKQEEERKKQLESVTKLWQQLYDRQREEVLKWPPALNSDFRTTVEKKEPFKDEIPAPLRNHYQNYIDRHFPELPKKINARVIEDATTGSGAGFGRGGGRFGGEGEGGPGFIPGMMPEDDDYICEWLDQGYVRDELNFPERPSSLRIWVTQEDLWVYHTLLNVIAKTNQAANATRMSNAAVKMVYSLEVGRRAAPYSRQPNRLAKQPPAAAAVPGAGFEGENGPAGASAGFGPSSRGMGGEGGGFGDIGGSAMSPADEQAFLMSGRYLDEKGMPIPVGGGAAAEGGEPGAPLDPSIASAPPPPLDMAQFGVGYKRLPIRMAMQMDLRWLPQLIANCANEPLRVEVQEVRINPSDLAGAESGSGGFGGGSRFGGFGGFGGERGFGGGGGGGGFRGGGASDASLFPDLTGIQIFPAQPHVGNVVIQGIIYVFNKPDMNLLEQASSEPAVAAVP